MTIIGRIGLIAALVIGGGPGARADEPTPAERAEALRRHSVDPATALGSRVKETPAAVLEMFKEFGGPAPTTHVLSDAERRSLEAAIEALTPLHRRVLKDRLRSFSFLDGMPNTALTATIDVREPYRLFDITFNASILRLTASEWLTSKDRTCFDAAGSPLSVSIDGGKLDAIVYVLLHEATHVVDLVLRFTPEVTDSGRAGISEATTDFTRGVWDGPRIPVARFRDPTRDRVRFYKDGTPLPIDRAEGVYDSLRRTPFVSLYGSSNWGEDLAEYVAVFQMTETLKQPFRIVIRDGDKEVFAHEPMKSDLVRERSGQMNRFYQGTL